jgi:Domain of unknown function (DUF5655)
MSGPDAPLWTCPRCGRAFANPRQSHTCAPLTRLEDHFARSAPEVRAAFEAILTAVRRVGPVTVLPEKSRIALQVRMSFVALIPRRRWLNGHLVLARPIDSPRLLSVQTLSPRNVVHTFRLHGPEEVDAEFSGWLTEAYRVGEQRHLHDRPFG